MNLPNWINKGTAEEIAYRRGYEDALGGERYSFTVIDDIGMHTKPEYMEIYHTWHITPKISFLKRLIENIASKLK